MRRVGFPGVFRTELYYICRVRIISVSYILASRLYVYTHCRVYVPTPKRPSIHNISYNRDSKGMHKYIITHVYIGIPVELSAEGAAAAVWRPGYVYSRYRKVYTGDRFFSKTESNLDSVPRVYGHPPFHKRVTHILLLCVYLHFCF